MKINVLIIDDERVVRDMIHDMIDDWRDGMLEETQKVDVDVKKFYCGNQLEKDLTDEWKPDLCCTDFVMDFGDGKFVVEKMRQSFGEELPILLITAWSKTHIIECVANRCDIVEKDDLDFVSSKLNENLDKIWNAKKSKK